MFAVVILTIGLHTNSYVLAIQDLTTVPAGETITLEDCINYAFENSPIIKKAKNNVLAAKSKIGQAKSTYFPSLSASTGYYIQQNGENWDRSKNYHGVSVDLSQKIYDFGKMNATLNASKYNTKAAELALEYAYVQTAYNVKMRYINCLHYWAKVLINQRNVAIQQLQYERAKALFDEGLKSRIDVVDAEVALDNAKFALVEITSDYYTEIMLLKNAMYWANCPQQYKLAPTEAFNILTDYKYESDLSKSIDDADFHTVLTQGIHKENVIAQMKDNFFVLPHDIDWYLDYSRKNNPYILGIKLIENAANENLKGTKRMYNPDIDLALGYNLRNTNVLVSNGFNAGVKFGFGGINAMYFKTKIEEAKANLAMAQNDTETYIIDNEWDVRDKVAWMLKFPKEVEIKLDQIERSLEYFELADGRYSVGTGNFIELQNAANEYYKAQLDYVDVISEYNQVYAMLEKSIGMR
ncbi:TolC family protein [bacterium]|nr:TolC family protein [bacterium]